MRFVYDRVMGVLWNVEAAFSGNLQRREGTIVASHTAGGEGNVEQEVKQNGDDVGRCGWYSRDERHRPDVG